MKKMNKKPVTDKSELYLDFRQKLGNGIYHFDVHIGYDTMPCGYCIVNLNKKTGCISIHGLKKLKKSIKDDLIKIFSEKALHQAQQIEESIF